MKKHFSYLSRFCLIISLVIAASSQLAFTDISLNKYISAGQKYYDEMTLSTVPDFVRKLVPKSAYDIAFRNDSYREILECSVDFEILGDIKELSEKYKLYFEKQGYVMKLNFGATTDKAHFDYSGTGINHNKNISISFTQSKENPLQLSGFIFVTNSDLLFEDVANTIKIPKPMQLWNTENALITYFYAYKEGAAIKMESTDSFEENMELYRNILKNNGFSEVLCELQLLDDGNKKLVLYAINDKYKNSINKEAVEIIIEKLPYEESHTTIWVDDYIYQSNPFDGGITEITDTLSKIDTDYREWFDSGFNRFYKVKYRNGEINNTRLYFTSKRSFEETIAFFCERLGEISDSDRDSYVSEAKFGKVIEMNDSESDWWFLDDNYFRKTKDKDGTYSSSGSSSNIIISVLNKTKIASGFDGEVGDVAGFIIIN